MRSGSHKLIELIKMVSAFGLHRLAFGDPLAFLKGITAKPPLRGGFAGFICRDDWIRTSDPYVPNVVRYRAALHPEENILVFKFKNISSIRELQNLQGFLIRTIFYNFI